MRTYLVVIDDSPEAALALRFAARRAVRTGGGVAVLAIVPPQDFVAFGGVQATIEAEAREHAEELVAAAAATIAQEGNVTPQIMVRTGKPAEVVREVIAGDAEIAALVLATAASGAPGPLVAHFTGQDAGGLPCPVMLVPGGIDIARLDALS
ncbi:universal stress protein [Sphingopyxis sp. YF1]|jgi:nucleotide-binding universal stress UspA family protein|uniref:universal stress protein n=1 Tax=Sphingopyxis sp. YF1 TaxID=2482763 RepID=UPI001F607AEA|nr:universal stress protein [Sphingopyxis sp. YF1]UNU42942.1 universal stress protein [Sphingopyxis sp. YF1]